MKNPLRSAGRSRKQKFSVPGDHWIERRATLGMSERDVERACAAIANSLEDSGFKVSDSLVRNLERRSILPGAKKLYSLCRVYQMSPFEVYSWYGIPFGRLLEERFAELAARTVPVDFDTAEVDVVPAPEGHTRHEISADRTDLIVELAGQWGESLAPLLLSGAGQGLVFGKVGRDDLFLYPLVLPGSLLVIDPAQASLAVHQQGSYWTRPIYFLEVGGDYAFGYCEMLSSGRLLLTPHADSPSTAREIEMSEDVRIVGRVISIAIPEIDRHFGTV